MAEFLPMRCNYTESLKELCIKCIVNHFNRFMIAYENSSIPVQHFEFLQRTSSKDLLQRLAERNRLADSYISFLVNPHLKELNLSNIKINPELVLERLKVTGTSIKLLNLNEVGFSYEILIDFVTAVPSVETLLLRDTECNDCVLKTIGHRCQSLEKLDLSDCIFVTNESINDFLGKDEEGQLQKNTVLQYLDLTWTKVSESGVSTLLKHAPMLRTLHHDQLTEVIYRTHCRDFSNGHTDPLPKYLLTSLHFHSQLGNDDYSSQTLVDVVQVCSAFCPYVTTLRVRGDLDESLIKACAEFKDLRDVQLFHLPYGSRSSSLNPFVEARGVKLQDLFLDHVFISANVFSDYCHRLHSLTMYAVEFDDNGIQNTVDCFPQLREFRIDNANFALKPDAASVLHFISNSPSLEILELRHARSLTIDVVNEITRCKCISTIKLIDCSYSDVDVAGALDIMASAKSLERFVIERVHISKAEYDELKRSSTQRVKIVWSPYVSKDDDPRAGHNFEQYYHFGYVYYDDSSDDYDVVYNSDRADLLIELELSDF